MERGMKGEEKRNKTRAEKMEERKRGRK